MDWRRQAVVVNGAESHKDLWRVGYGNAEWMFGTRNVPRFWLDKGVAHGCPPIRSTPIQGVFRPRLRFDPRQDRRFAAHAATSRSLVFSTGGDDSVASRGLRWVKNGRNPAGKMPLFRPSCR